ncbi:serine hydrolase [Winogradskyella sp.]|uniref:serine hydrolase domain-containing protein n=1 Tax=Winogradskyella sp. TaxID=1883156 RepID=UPI00260FDF7F|nr:serine hydrolase domain-containing protein [Winogradskyella sp.]
MKKTLLICLLTVFLINCKESSKEQNETPSIALKTTEQIRQIDSLIQHLVSQKHTLGVSFGIQVNDSEPFVASYGIADLQSNTEVNKNTIFSLASITKPITALGIGILAQENKLSFDNTIDQYFPDFPNGHRITIYQLLSHTSGIPETWIGGLPENISSDWTIEPNPHLVLQKMKNPSIFEPGTKYAYSNSGYLLLGEIIEQVSGQSYQDFIKEKVLEKYAANHSFIDEKGMEKNNFWTKGYGIKITDSTNNQKAFFQHDFEAFNLKSFGGLKSNPMDLLQITNKLFKGKIVNDSILNEMTSYAKTSNGNYVYDELYLPSDFELPKLPDYIEKNGYGLGFSLMNVYNVPVIWHSGGMPGYNAVLAHFPNSNTTIVMCSNTDNGLIPEYESIMKICSEIGEK